MARATLEEGLRERSPHGGLSVLEISEGRMGGIWKGGSKGRGYMYIYG